MRSTNVAGRSYSLMLLAPVRADAEDELLAYLRGLGSDGESPFGRLARTHFVRLAVVHDMPVPRGVKDPLGGPHLLVTANLDGDLDSWLDLLLAELSAEAKEIWGRCRGCPSPASGPELKAYLLRHQLDSGVVFAAYGQASVQRIRGALDKRARLVDFVVRAQELEPAERRRAFLDEFGS